MKMREAKAERHANSFANARDASCRGNIVFPLPGDSNLEWRFFVAAERAAQTVR